MIDEKKVVDITLEQIIKRTDSVFPKNVIPAYHYCDDWRTLAIDGWHALWDSKPKIAHIDLVRYQPEIGEEQAEKINIFLKRGGGLALGILPNLDESYSKPLKTTLEENLVSTLVAMQKNGIDLERVQRQSMISTQCGLSGASEKLTRNIHKDSPTFPEVFLDALDTASK
jgi:hypothetical protein